VHPGETIVTAIEWYLRIGVGIAIVFVSIVGRVVPSARGGSIAFRLLVIPGATLLWPLIVVRTIRALLAPARKQGAHE
jgi:hypothetical protein